MKLLRDPAGAQPVVMLAGVTFDFAVVADDLETSREQLLAARGKFQRTVKATDGTRTLVNGAIKQFDGVFPWVTSGIESAFRLAGEHELADRIRTSRRRVTRRQAASKGESVAGESATAEPSVGESTAAAPLEPLPPPSGS